MCRCRWRKHENQCGYSHHVGGTHVIGTQRDPSPAPGTELSLAVGAQVSAAISKLGLVADATGGGVILVLALLPLLGGLRPSPPHLLLVVGKLLVQTGRGEEMEKKKGDIKNSYSSQCNICT